MSRTIAILIAALWLSSCGESATQKIEREKSERDLRKMERDLRKMERDLRKIETEQARPVREQRI